MPDLKAITAEMPVIMLGVAHRMVVPIALVLPNAPTSRAENASAGLLPWERMMTEPISTTSSAATTYLSSSSLHPAGIFALSFILLPSKHIHTDRLLVQPGRVRQIARDFAVIHHKDAVA